MSMHLLASFLIALTVAATAAAADVRLITRELRNGVTVVLAPDVSSDALAMHVTFDAGSRHDIATTHGTAWLASGIVGARLGFDVDVNQERSVFAAQVPPGHLRDVLAKLATALSTSAVTDEEFTTAKEAALENRRQSVGTRDAAAQDLLLQLVYGRQAHSRSPRPEPTHVRRRDVETFLKKHYHPSSLVIGLAGTFDVAAVTAAVDATVATLPGGRRRARCKPYRLKLSGERRREVVSSLAKFDEIHIGYPTAAAPAKDWYALNILADIIGQGPKSRLQQVLVGRGLAVDFGEGVTESPCAASLLRMRVRIAPGVSVAAVMSAMDEGLRELAHVGVSDAEIVAAREQERQWSEQQLSTDAGVAGAAARTVLFYGDAERLNTDVARMFEVSRADVQRVAQEYVLPTNRAVVIVRRSAPLRTLMAK